MLKHLEGDALTFNELKNMMGHKNSELCLFLSYDELSKIKSFKQLFSNGHDAAIILLQSEYENAPAVGHFILLLNQPEHIEHFDSYGLTVDEENKITGERHLTQLFNDSKKSMIQNTKQLQRFKNDIQTCGRWVVARYLLKTLNLTHFLQIITKLGGHLNDESVTLMTMLLPLKQ